MKPVDIRNETWFSIRSRLENDRMKVWQGYYIHGPCSTRELAEKIGLTIFTVRPRTTELIDMLLVSLVGRGKDGGLYAHVPLETAEKRFNDLKDQSPKQLSLMIE